MSANPTVNRYLDDKTMDHIDHALGRPMWPQRESYRNYFAIDVRSDLAAQFDASPNWELRNVTPDAMGFYSVTDEGRSTLDAYLDGHDRHRAFLVTYSGVSVLTPAKSAAKARYSVFLDVRDVDPDLTFRDFLHRAVVEELRP